MLKAAKKAEALDDNVYVIFTEVPELLSNLCKEMQFISRPRILVWKAFK